MRRSSLLRLILPLTLTIGACVPRYAELPPMSPAELATPLPVQRAVVNGVNIAYIDSGGEGEVIVLIHGLSSTIGFWERQVQPLSAAGYRVLALDLPGFGASGRPDAPYTPPWYAALIRAWLDGLGVGSAHLVGHSMGGQIAMTMALETPDRVQSLILSAPAGIERFTPGEAEWMKTYWTETRTLEASEQDVRANFTMLAFNRYDEGVERLIQERVRMSSTPEFKGTSVAVSRCVAGMVDYPVADRLGEIQTPTLILFGEDDHMIPNPIFHGGRTKTVALAGQDGIPGSELVLISKAGHTVHHDAPDAFNAAVLEFLEST
ncbi:MAG: hypothetical protein RIT28_3751 [Pseudomonadota bacterium]